jgi:hypothetical protein
MMNKSRRRWNKKAIVFSAMLFVFGLMLFGKVYTSFEGKVAELSAGKIVGQNELGVIDAVLKAEKVMLYDEQLSKYVAYDTIHFLADHGGFVLGCDYHEFLPGQRYLVWKSKDKECFPTLDHLKLRFKKHFAQEFTEHSKKNPLFNYSAKKVVENFAYSVDIEAGKTVVRGYAFTPIRHNIKCEYGGEKIPITILKDPLPLVGKFTIGYREAEKTQALCGGYLFRPSFSHHLDYDLSEYEEIVVKAKEIYNECSISTNMTGCVENKVKRLTTSSLSWKLVTYAMTSGNKAVAFDIEVTQKNFRFALYAQPVIKFAIAIPLP